MISFLGQPLIYKQLDALKLAGVTEITIVGGYHAEHLKLLNIQIIINHRFAETNMVYSLFCAESSMKPGEDLIISYGDIVFEPKILKALQKSNAPISVVIDKSWLELWSERMDDPLSDAETLKLSDDNKIVEIGKKSNNYADIQGQFIGLIKVKANKIKSFKEAWHSIDKNILFDKEKHENIYMTNFIQYLINIGWDVRAIPIERGWLEIDTVEDLNHYERMEIEGRLIDFFDFQNK